MKKPRETPSANDTARDQIGKSPSAIRNAKSAALADFKRREARTL
jgi:hypothetical protein